MSMLDMIVRHHDEIVTQALHELRAALPSRPVADVQAVVTNFLGEVRESLRKELGLPSAAALPGRTLEAAREGREKFEAGYDIMSAVRDYGAVCDALGEVAIRYGETFLVRESQVLNQCVDAAASTAVDEYWREATQESGRRTDELVRGIAHAVQSELSTARMAYRAVQSGMVGVNSRTGAIVERSFRQIEHVLARALTALRLQTNPQLQLQEIDVDAWLTAMVAAAPRERGVTFALAIEPELIVEGDVSILSTAVAQILQNAVKYSGQNAVVHVGARSEHELVTVSVADACGGLPPGIREDLYLPYLTEGVAGDTPRLGLTLVQHAVRAHGGEVRVENRPGAGCTFALRLPRRQPS